MPDDLEHPDRLAGRNWRRWVLLATITTAIVTADLVAKTLAFKHVADRPLCLARAAEGDKTIVLARQPNGDLRQLPTQRPGDPASAIPHHAGRLIVPYVLQLHLTINTGAVFGQGKGLQRVFVLFTGVAIVMILWVFSHSGSKALGLHLALSLIMSGAIGNLYDRLRFNAVRDMLWLFPNVRLPFGWHWPLGGGSDQLYPWIFNVADAALLIGVLLMFVVWRRQPLKQAS